MALHRVIPETAASAGGEALPELDDIAVRIDGLTHPESARLPLLLIWVATGHPA